MKLYKSYYFLILIVICSCVSQKETQLSTDHLYKKENSEINTKYTLYHLNDSISELYYEFSNENIIYKKTDTSSYFYSHIRFSINVYHEDNIRDIIDSTILIIKDRQVEAVTKTITGSIIVNLKSKSNYYLGIKIADLHKKVSYATQLYSNKSSTETRQNFLALNSLSNVFFNSYFKPGEMVYLQSLQHKELIYEIDYFKPNFKLALPPFSVGQMTHFNYKPDSVFKVNKNNGILEMTMPNTGFFHLKTNNVTKDGVTFFVYESSFPKIKNSEQMVLATRYIMSKKEFDNCLLATDKKVAIDKFWLEIGGSNERAKELIKKYYGRVQDANKLFTSFQEGWKTDRGMIYIVFGSPSKVIKQKNGEQWIYGENNNVNSTVFSFLKIINPFTDNDYYLERSEYFKEPWYQAVDMWRQGKIYLEN